MSKKIEGTIWDESFEDKSKKDGKARKDIVTAAIDERGVYLSIKGYSDHNGGDEIVMLENYGGKLRLIIWADKTSEDPTHTIDLEGAKDE